MEFFLKISVVVLELVCLLWGGCYLTAAIAGLKNRKRHASQPPGTKFCILIAARNEQSVIGELVDSLRGQNYPRELYQIWVIPNQCTDDTGRCALEHGANVLSCRAPVRTKGEVIHYAYQQLRPLGFDAYCVFDADNVADENFLLEMNAAILSGAAAAQGYRDSKNPGDSLVSAWCSVYYWMMDRFFNQGKAALGLSAMINGTGFAVTQSLLDRLGGWNAQTISEDMELTVQCVLAGEKIAWVPGAVTYDEQPLSIKQSFRQRRRWVSGTMQVGRCYGKRLWSLRERWMHVMDMGVTLMLPSYQILVLLCMVLAACDAAMVGESAAHALLLGCGEMLKRLAGVAAGSVCAAILVVLTEGKRAEVPVVGVLCYGIFVLSWLPITVRCLFKKTTRWEPIPHTRSLQQRKHGKKADALEG